MNRYSRNILTIGTEGQQRLSDASVFIIGCGALGGQVAMLLAGAGVGRIGLADFDTIDISNLQRQLFFSEDAAGQSKLEVLSSRMHGLNSEICIEKYPVMIQRKNAREILAKFRFVVDATDNPVAKYMIDDICNELGLPHCIGGVSGWGGQVTSVNPNGEYKEYRDIFPQPDDNPALMPCAVEGVIGATASAIASVQAGEVIKFFTGEGVMLYDRLLVMDMKGGFMQTFDFS